MPSLRQLALLALILTKQQRYHNDSYALTSRKEGERRKTKLVSVELPATQKF